MQWAEPGRSWFDAAAEQPQALGVSVHTRKAGFQDFPEPPARPGGLRSSSCWSTQQCWDSEGGGGVWVWRLRTDLGRPARGRVTLYESLWLTRPLGSGRGSQPRGHDTAQEPCGNVCGTSRLSHWDTELVEAWDAG